MKLTYEDLKPYVDGTAIAHRIELAGDEIATMVDMVLERGVCDEDVMDAMISEEYGFWKYESAGSSDFDAEADDTLKNETYAYIVSLHHEVARAIKERKAALTAGAA